MSKYSNMGKLKKVVVQTYYYEYDGRPNENTRKQQRNNNKCSMPRERVITHYDERKQIDYRRPANFVSKFRPNALSQNSFDIGLENQASPWETESLGESFLNRFEKGLTIPQQDEISYISSHSSGYKEW